MIETSKLDFTRCAYQPYEHQIEGVNHLIQNKFAGLFDEMGIGKTKQVIDTACLLYEAGEIDLVLIMCPAQVKDVWIHPQYSQIIQHSFVKGVIHEFTSLSKSIPAQDRGLTWIVVSIELLRNPSHVVRLSQMLNLRRVWSIVDESSTISNWKAAQTKGALALTRRHLRRCILNGTPVGQSILNLYSQLYFVDPQILGFKNFFAFRNHHCQMGGWMGKQVVGYHYLEELQAKIKPFVLRRLKKDCLDLPPKIIAPLKEVRLTQESWKHYCSMRDEFVAFLESTDEVSVVNAAPVKALRLAQICSGFLGGIDDEVEKGYKTAEIGSELTDSFMDHLSFRLETTDRLWLIIWCRFRPEIARLEKRIRGAFPQIDVRVLQGGLSKSAREEAKTLFHPDNPDPKGHAVLIGQPQAGRFGLNFAKCSTVDRLSSDYSLLTRLQSDDRVDRPGQRNPMLFTEYIVVGPNRERTISGIILKSLKNSEDMARWTTRRWEREILQEESDYEPF